MKPIVFDAAAMLVQLPGGGILSLSNPEYLILAKLTDARGAPVRSAILEQEVSGGQLMRTTIWRLRKKLGEDRIHNVCGHGYALAGGFRARRLGA